MHNWEGRWNIHERAWNHVWAAKRCLTPLWSPSWVQSASSSSGTEVRSGAVVVNPMVHHKGDAGGTFGIMEATCGLVWKRDSCFQYDGKITQTWKVKLCGLKLASSAKHYTKMPIYSKCGFATSTEQVYFHLFSTTAAGAYPSYLWLWGGVHPEQITNSSQG